MLTFEYIVLGFTYTSVSIALFLQLLCFKRKIESIEAIAFTVSLLFLVVSVSLSTLFLEGKTTTVSTLIAMVLVAATTLLNTLSERKHAINAVLIKTHTICAVLLIIGILVAFWMDYLLYIQYTVVAFLIFSVLVAMIIVRLTKPIKRYDHLEKANKLFALTFLVLVPVYLIFHYAFEYQYDQFQMGFLLYVAFAALAVSKIYDDLQRLSLLHKNTEPRKQQFKNYGLTEREEEIAVLLTKGLTYQRIAEQLFISLPTVKTHAGNIYKKCQVNTRNELTYLVTH